MSRNKRWMAAIGGLVVAGMLLAACAPAPVATEPEVVEVEVTRVVEVEVEGETQVETETIIVTATPEPEGVVELVSDDPDTFTYVAFSEGIDTLDPAWNYESEGDAAILNIYEQLVTYDGSSATSYVPALAESWDISDDGMTYVFQIREGVKFHDGADLSAEDVAYTFQRGVLQGGGWSPQWLYTEALFGNGVYDAAELVDETGALDDDPEGLQAADPELLMAACEQVMDAIVADEAAGTITFNLMQPWAPWLSTIANIRAKKV